MGIMIVNWTGKVALFMGKVALFMGSAINVEKVNGRLHLK